MIFLSRIVFKRRPHIDFQERRKLIGILMKLVKLHEYLCNLWSFLLAMDWSDITQIPDGLLGANSISGILHPVFDRNGKLFL